MLQFLLQQVDVELSGAGDDAALPRLVSPEDEVGRSEQLRRSQAGLGLLIAEGTEETFTFWGDMRWRDTSRVL